MSTRHTQHTQKNSSETSDTDEDENLNTWNVLLELLTMPGSGVQGGSVVPCFTGHSVLVHGMISRGATTETPNLSGASLRLHSCRRGK